MTPTKCQNCGERIPPTLPRFVDDLGQYVICPACSSSQDDDTPTTPEEG